MKSLIVTSPFGGRNIGRRITDAAEIVAILVGENAPHVVVVNHPEAPALPEPEPPPAAKSKKPTRQE